MTMLLPFGTLQHRNGLRRVTTNERHGAYLLPGCLASSALAGGLFGACHGVLLMLMQAGAREFFVTHDRFVFRSCRWGTIERSSLRGSWYCEKNFPILLFEPRSWNFVSINFFHLKTRRWVPSFGGLSSC